MATLEENIRQAISDFDGIKAAIEEKGVEVPHGTDTSQYGSLIGEIGVDEYNRGYEAGYAKGYAEGETAGYTQGEAQGRTEGYAQGKTDGHAEGYTEGYAKGYADGYAAGYEAGQEAGYTKGHAEGYTEGETVGRETGYAEGHDVGYAEGEKAEYDRFWDTFQQNGNRSSYSYGFAGQCWTGDTYNPKYDIYCYGPNNANSMFTYSYLTDTKVRITLEESKGFQIFLYAEKLKRIPLISLVGNVQFQNTFIGCTALTYIRFEGAIQNPIDFGYSPNLSDDSVQNIIDHLKDRTGLSAATLTFHATVGNNMTAEQKAAITAKNWTLVY